MIRYKKRKVKKHIFQNIIFVIIILYLLIDIINTNSDINSKEIELKNKNVQVLQLQEDIAEKKKMLSLDEEEFLENYIRDNYGYSYPNERIFIHIH